MSRINMIVYWFSYLFCAHYVWSDFSPNLDDYDAYGVKIAMNDNLLVLAQNMNHPPTFFIQYLPYTNINQTNQCSLPYPNIDSMFVYTVAIGKNQPSNDKSFFYAGEIIGNTTHIFVGKAINNQNGSSTVCDPSQYTYSTQYLPYKEHQEYYVLSAHSSGRYVYGFANRFVFIYNPDLSPSLITWDGNQTWLNSTFTPHAVDMADTYGVVAGFAQNPPNSRVAYVPVIYLFIVNSSTNAPVVRDIYQPIATPNSWQDLLENTNANLYSAKYDMSVVIDSNGRVLVGMQFVNRVFYFSAVLQNATSLKYISRYTNGRSLGNGKSIALLGNGMVAVVINVYSLSYVWSSSQVFFFDMNQSSYFNASTIPVSVYPNSDQILPSSYSPIFLSIVSSKSGSLTVLNDQGQLILLTPANAGYFSQVDESVKMPYFTKAVACRSGSYKSVVGVFDCTLCPTGTRSWNSGAINCTACNSTSFCPLGAVADIPNSEILSTSQVLAYPQSPETVIFEEILIQNMFQIQGGRCLVISPLFWALIVGGAGIIFGLIIEMIRLCAKRVKHVESTEKVKFFLKHADLISEGEYWFGGLASFAVIVLVCFSYSFSARFYNQYPSEFVSDSSFACDVSIRNAKFDTNALSLAIPFGKEEQEMVNLLLEQNFEIDIDLINTVITCDTISLQALSGIVWSTLRYDICRNNTDGILSLTVTLPTQFTTIQVLISNASTIGALRLRIYGHGEESDRHHLKKLDVYQTFSTLGKILSYNLPLSIVMTKVINETKPLVGEEANYSAIYLPTFSTDPNVLFVNNNQYILSSGTNTTITIITSETTYYVKNVQQPIARISEVIFRTIIFTIVTLEIFGLIFLIYKLLLKPIYSVIKKKFFPHNTIKDAKKKESQIYLTDLNKHPVAEEKDDNTLTYAF